MTYNFLIVAVLNTMCHYVEVIIRSIQCHNPIIVFYLWFDVTSHHLTSSFFSVSRDMSVYD